MPPFIEDIGGLGPSVPKAAMALSSVKIVAGGRGINLALPKVVDKVLSLARPPVAGTHSVLYIGTPSYDKHNRFENLTAGFRKAGCDVIRLDVTEAGTSNPYLNPTIPSRIEMEEKITSADVILVSGGNTLYAYNRWKELGIDELLRKVAFQKDGMAPVLCGGSAGAILWFRNGHSDSMDPQTLLNVNPELTEAEKSNWEYIRVPGLDIIPALCVPHHDATQTNGVPRSQDSNEMLTKHPDDPCIGIEEDAVFVVADGCCSVLSGTGSGKCYLKVCRMDAGGRKKIFVKELTEESGKIPLSGLTMEKSEFSLDPPLRMIEVQ